MATRTERQDRLEQFSEHDFEELVWDGPWCKRPRDSRIKWLLDDAERDNHGDRFDHALSLLTDDEQRLELQKDMVDAAKSSSRASWVSARAALISTVCAVLAVVTGRRSRRNERCSC